MGGLRFGPFPGAVTIGSDSRRSQLVLDPAHGVYPVHATLTPGPDATFTLAPATRECKVFLMPMGQAHLWPVTGPVQAKVGDLVVVGTPIGPRFQILQDVPAGAAPSASSVLTNARATGGEAGLVQGMSQLVDGVIKPRSSSLASGVAKEVQRQATSRALAGQGVARDAYQVWTRVRTGMLSNPVWIAGILIALVGLVGTGSVSCTGISYVLLDVLGIRR
jgi:hypothetical protein